MLPTISSFVSYSVALCGIIGKYNEGMFSMGRSARTVLFNECDFDDCQMKKKGNVNVKNEREKLTD